MNSPSLQAGAAESSEPNCSASAISDTLSGTITVSESSPPESGTESSMKPQFSAMSAHSSVKGTPQAIRDWLMCLPQDSRANRSVLPGSEKPKQTKEICGPQQQTLFGLSSHDEFCLKTCLEYADTCPWSSETCGDLAMRFDDPCGLGLTMLGHHTEEKESGFLPTPTATVATHGGPNQRDSSGRPGLQMAAMMWPTPKASAAGPDFAKLGRSATGVNLATAVAMFPTPTASNTKAVHMRGADKGRTRQPRSYLPTPTVHGNYNRKGCSATSGDGLATFAAKYPTPCAQDAKNSTLPISQRDRDSIPGYLLSNGERPGGQLNPGWVEWLMGFPIGWTSLAPLPREAVEDCGSEEWWKAEPDGVPRVASGIPARIDRLKALGNGQVPQVAALAWKILRGEL